ncbi:MAG: hypothetical protein JNJ50_10980 [Acidobacteria bacterium]|nr:hypothetical protein [Acidobacteriota bacterium]
MRNPWRLLLTIGLLGLSAFISRAERLPVRQYTVADGLAQGTVWAMHQDARGFLWLATSDGLSRFDGYRFTNYGVRDGLGYAQLRDVISDRRGRLWVATGDGVSLLLDEKEAVRQGRKFKNFLLTTGEGAENINDTHRILFDAENRMWCVTFLGLYRARSAEVATEQFDRVVTFDVLNTPPQLVLDRRGRVWVSVDGQLHCIESGKVTSYQLWQKAGETAGLPELRWVKGLAELPDGRILLATNKDLYEFIEPAAAGRRGSWRKLPLRLSPQNIVGTIQAAADGGLWIGSEGLLIRYRDGRQADYRLGNDTNPFRVMSFLSDRDGNLWLGTRQRGLLKLKGEALLIYDGGDRLVPVMDIYYSHATHDGRMILAGRPISPRACNETFLTGNLAQGQGALTRLQPPPGLCIHDVLQDSRQNWWVLRWLADRKIYKLRFIPGPNLNFSAGYELTATDGWVDGGYGVLYEDHEGYVWLRKGGGGQIFRIEHADNGRPRVVEVVREGVTGFAIYFLRHPSGSLWWTDGGTVWRNQYGKVAAVALPVEKPRPRWLFADGKGRLWIGTIEHGVFMTESPDSGQPRFVNYTAADGLPSGQIITINEDDDGNHWFGTIRGLYRQSEKTGRFNPVSFGENLLSSAVSYLNKDQSGHLWASVMGAVIRINPRLLPRPAPQVPVYFNRVSLAGEPLALGETGAVNLSPPALAAGQNNLEIEFVSPNFRDETAVRYQHKLEGVDSDWSAPGNAREVNYARLAAGSYTFLVRAVGDAGEVSAEPASLRFTILRPVWQRWWFVLVSLIGLGAIGYGLHRYRLTQLLRVERVRTRIARDLHDDVGAGLSQISLLSEVIQRRASDDTAIAEPLSAIAGTSRELVDTMSDIVWTNNPRFDHLGDLVHRMRRFASELLTARGIRLQTDFPANDGDLPLEPETRRQIYLIFKEASNNLARHSGCDEANISLHVTDGWLHLRIADNGCGFDLSSTAEGNGLRSLRARAESIGGNIEVDSHPGQGTVLKFTLLV